MSIKLTITAVALAAALAGPALAAGDGRYHARHGHEARPVQSIAPSTARASVDRVFDADARGPFNSPPEFAGYPTDYLMNRFGDRQMQGR
jgi:hypothetical protein